MPFNSHTARLAGKKSKRGKSKITPSILDRLELLATENLDFLLSNLDQLTNSERIKLTQILLGYTVSKMGTRPPDVPEEELDQPFIIEICKSENT